MSERIETAAIIHRGEPRSVPRPGRHHDVIRVVDAQFPDDGGIHGEQGFMTSAGRFVDRKEGLRIAKAAGQIVKKHGNDTMLFSEDMW